MGQNRPIQATRATCVQPAMLSVMCGRYANSQDLIRQAARCDAVLTCDPKEWTPSWNIAPQAVVPIVIQADNRRLGLMQWGWERNWAKRPLINAQIEKVATAPTWRDAFARRRCVVPCTGWWEWAQSGQTGPRKTPYHHRLADGSPFALAGLWERVEGHARMVIVTRPAVPEAAAIHPRMPMVLQDEEMDVWLDSGDDLEARGRELAASEVRSLSVYPVEPFGSRADGSELIAEAG